MEVATQVWGCLPQELSRHSINHETRMTTTGARIERLPRPEAARLRSSLVIPSLPTVLNELVQNALDAGGRRIDCWVNLVKGNESVRIEDDGSGISLQDLEVVGERHGRVEYRSD